MKLYIPTRGRPDRQPVATAFAAADLAFQLVCTERDGTLPAYKENFAKQEILIAPTKTLTEKRQWLYEHSPKSVSKFAMFDDDVHFYARKRNGAFRIAESKDIVNLIDWMEKALDKHAHVGLCDKFMSQHQPRGFRTRGRYNQVMGYNKQMIAQRLKELGSIERPRFRLTLNQEHDFHLQLLMLGLPPAVTCEFSKDAKYYAQGGCSAYRTPELEQKIFKELHRLWPDFVSLRETTHAIGGLAASFNWRKATNYGVQRYEQKIKNRR